MRAPFRTLALCALLCTALQTKAAVTVGVDPSKNWLGWMNVFELNNQFLWPSPWGTADLNATFTGPVLELTPNTSIARDVPLSDGYWWKPDGTGNKLMEANFYVEDSATLPGEVVTFEGLVLDNTVDPSYNPVAFIKDFAPDYSSSVMVAAPLQPGAFSITLATGGGGRHVQYGFLMKGPNVARGGNPGAIHVTAAPVIPEPGSMALLGTAVLPLLALRRRKS